MSMWGPILSFGAGLLGSYFQAKNSRGGVRGAAAAQVDAANQGIGAVNSAQEQITKLLSPYMTAGTGASAAQGNLIGLGGAEAQQQAIAGIQNGPQFQAMLAAGENSILQNAAATGGLRGGNTQAMLAQYSPQLLSGLLDQQFSQLGSISNLGAQASFGQASALQNTAGNLSNLYGNIGEARAGKAISLAGINNEQLGAGLAAGSTFAKNYAPLKNFLYPSK